MPKFNPNKFKNYVSKLDIKNPSASKKALKYVLDRSEYKPSERKTILNSFDKGDYSNFSLKKDVVLHGMISQNTVMFIIL